MKLCLLLLFVVTSAFAQDPAAYLKNFDARIYSLKNKGVRDFVVDIQSSKLTKQLNDQQLFGKVDEVVFRTYWTAAPERLAIEVIGLPDGFKEVKEELKLAILGLIENVLPQTLEQKFAGYKFVQGQGKEIVAQDTTGVAPIPSFTLKFDKQDVLQEVVGHRPIGTLVTKPVYEKQSFADGKLVLAEQTTVTSDNGQTIEITKSLNYGKSNGVGVLSEIDVTTEQKAGNAKPLKSSETVELKNYRINEGEALKYFLGEQKLESSSPKK